MYNRNHNRRYNNKYNAAIAHVEAYNRLESQLGPIVNDVKQIFLNFDNTRKSNFLIKYGKIHGRKATKYAEDTFDSWKSGKTKMAGQTAERILNLVPEFMSFDVRFELVRKLHKHFTKRLTYNINIHTDNPNQGLNELNSTMNTITSMPTGELPSNVFATIKWLNNSDAIASKLMIEKIDQEMNLNSKSIAKLELSKIYSTINNSEDIQANYRILLVNAIINVKFIRPKKSFWKRILG